MNCKTLSKVFATTLGVCAASALHASDFGTAEEAQGLAAQMSAIIAEGGVEAAMDAMHDPSMPFVTSIMGVHVFEESVIVADNREPELIATSYATVEDLTGEVMWPRIVAAADTNSEAILEWYHYDTEAEYSYQCYSEWASETAIVMVCR